MRFNLSIKSILLMLFLSLTLSLVQYIPHLLWIGELWKVVLCIFLLGFLIYMPLKRGGLKFTSFELYIFVLCLIPIYSAIGAYLEFGQPLIYGVLSERAILLIISSLLLIHAFRLGLINQKDIEGSFVYLSWIVLLICLLLNTFGDPAAYEGIAGLVSGNDMIGYEFIFPASLVAFAVIYYFMQGVKTGNVSLYLKVLPFLLFLVLVIAGRSLLVSLFIAIAILSWRYISFVRLTVWLPKALLVGVGVIVLLIAIKPTYMSDLGKKFDDAISVVLSGEAGNDASANARIYEIATAMPYIEKNWLFGNGHLSHQWEDGYESKLGYFFPSDIGLVGILYKYGVFGLFIFMGQFFFAYKYLKKIPKKERSVLALSVEGYLIYVACHSLVTGEFVGYAEVSLLFIAILYIEVMQINKPQASRKLGGGLSP